MPCRLSASSRSVGATPRRPAERAVPVYSRPFWDDQASLVVSGLPGGPGSVGSTGDVAMAAPTERTAGRDTRRTGAGCAGWGQLCFDVTCRRRKSMSKQSWVGGHGQPHVAHLADGATIVLVEVHLEDAVPQPGGHQGVAGLGRQVVQVVVGQVQVERPQAGEEVQGVGEVLDALRGDVVVLETEPQAVPTGTVPLDVPWCARWATDRSGGCPAAPAWTGRRRPWSAGRW